MAQSSVDSNVNGDHQHVRTVMTSRPSVTAPQLARTTSIIDEDAYTHSNGEIDPTVKVQLDILNQSAICINRMETELDETRNKYQSTFAEFSMQLELLKKNAGSSVKKARPFYELMEVARKKQSEILLSARKYQASNSAYHAAKERVSMAELHLKGKKAVCLSAAWQEMFKYDLLWVVEAEKEKSVSEQEHLKCAAEFADVERTLNILKQKHKRSITKARTYFETKKELEVKLQQVKQSVEDIQRIIKGAKQQYFCALECLEKISDSIHENRCHKDQLMVTREPGVGAEDCTVTNEIDQKCPALSTFEDISVDDNLYDSKDDSDENCDDDDDHE
uniref:Uncharacterized protein n=1 Tax=Arion vulgaris TaxID=1028688 RepID=A0A0B7BRM6_9EUPU